MRTRPTTICCSAVALTLFWSVVITAQRPSGRLSIFPVHPAWTTPIEAALTAPPGFAGARAFLPLDTEEVAAYDLSTGTEIWRAPGHTIAAPVPVDPLLYLVTKDALVALQMTDGGEVWRVPIVKPLASALMANAGWLIAAFDDGTITALRTAEGTSVWDRNVGAAANAPPTIDGDRLYVPTHDGRVIALALESGDIVWERRLGGPAHAILVRGDRLYVGSDDNFFYSIRIHDGVVDWRWRTGADIVGAPVADEHRVYFASLDNVLRGLDLRSGAQRWKRPLPVRPNSGPTLVAETVLVSGLSAVQAFQTKDGAPSGEVKAGGLLAAAPYVANSMSLPMPLIVYVSRSLETGVVLAAVTRDVEPAITAIAPLPNPTPVPLVLPGTEPPKAATSPDRRNH